MHINFYSLCSALAVAQSVVAVPIPINRLVSEVEITQCDMDCNKHFHKKERKFFP